MLFNSLQFLVFFAALFFAYYAIPNRYRSYLLLVASCYFYMAFVPAYILILFSLITVDYFLGLRIAGAEGSARKLLLTASIVTNLGALFFFKYFNFFNQNVAYLAHVIHWNYSPFLLDIILPLGLSFHVFQSLSYVVEVYRRKQVPERNYLVYALYVMFFPQLVAGPIERPQHMLHQFHEQHDFDSVRIRKGLEIMLWGFFKKLVIADNTALVVNHVYANLADSTGTMVLIAATLFVYQLYCDFSGYSDIAVGSAMVFGYDLMWNFDRPYSSRSIAEFWRRWHISLSTWLRDYLYYPLVFAKKRKSKLWLYFSLFITFVLIGLWHGANWTYVAFGAIHGGYMVFGQWTLPVRQRIKKAIGLATIPILDQVWQIGVTMVLVFISFIFFRATSLTQAIAVFYKIAAAPFELPFITLSGWKQMLKATGIGVDARTFLIIVLAIVFLEIVQWWQTRRGTFAPIEAKSRSVRWGWYYALVFSILIFGYLGAQTFIYFQF